MRGACSWGRDLAQGGRDHSSHRIACLGLSSKQTATVIYLISGLLTGVAVYLSLFQSGSPVLIALVAVAAASGMALLGIRLFRVPVAPAVVDAPETLARSGTALCEPQEDDLLVLNLPRTTEPDIIPEVVAAHSSSRETVKTR
jgi:hypothetical protein